MNPTQLRHTLTGRLATIVDLWFSTQESAASLNGLIGRQQAVVPALLDCLDGAYREMLSNWLTDATAAGQVHGSVSLTLDDLPDTIPRHIHSLDSAPRYTVHKTISNSKTGANEWVRKQLERLPFSDLARYLDEAAGDMAQRELREAASTLVDRFWLESQNTYNNDLRPREQGRYFYLSSRLHRCSILGVDNSARRALAEQAEALAIIADEAGLASVVAGARALVSVCDYSSGHDLDQIKLAHDEPGLRARFYKQKVEYRFLREDAESLLATIMVLKGGPLAALELMKEAS